MGICSYFKKEKLRIGAYTPNTKPFTGSERVYDVYIISEQQSIDSNIAVGAYAIRYGGPDGAPTADGVCYVVIKEDFWPIAARKRGLIWVTDLLQMFQKQLNRDIFLHEVGGHEVLGLGHDALNAVMQSGEFRSSRSSYDYNRDRYELELAIRDEYDAINVHYLTIPPS